MDKKRSEICLWHTWYRIWSRCTGLLRHLSKFGIIVISQYDSNGTSQKTDFRVTSFFKLNDFKAALAMSLLMKFSEIFNDFRIKYVFPLSHGLQKKFQNNLTPSVNPF